MTETSDGEAPALQTLGLLICTVEQGAKLLQTDKQRGRVIAHSWTRRPIWLITAGAGSAEEQLWELGESLGDIFCTLGQYFDLDPRKALPSL